MEIKVIPNHFQIKCNHIENDTEPWYEQYVRPIESDKEAIQYFKNIIDSFNKDLRGSKPRRLISIQRLYEIKTKDKKIQNKYFNIWGNRSK